MASDTPKESNSTFIKPAGPPEQSYLTVLAIIAFTFVALSGFFEYRFEDLVVKPFVSALGPNSLMLLAQGAGIGTFVIFPCFLFVTLYFYGKRTPEHFKATHVGSTLSLFLGSLIGYTFYISVLSLSGGLLGPLNGVFWLGYIFGGASTSLTSAFVGIAALALSYIRVSTQSAVP